MSEDGTQKLNIYCLKTKGVSWIKPRIILMNEWHFSIEIEFLYLV